MNHDHIILYRTGGSKACRWKKSVAMSKDTAEQTCQTIRDMGYKAIVRSLEEHLTIGWPIGWEWDKVDYDKDFVVVSEYGSYWEKNGRVVMRDRIDMEGV